MTQVGRDDAISDALSAMAKDWRESGPRLSDAIWAAPLVLDLVAAIYSDKRGGLTSLGQSAFLMALSFFLVVAVIATSRLERKRVAWRSVVLIVGFVNVLEWGWRFYLQLA